MTDHATAALVLAAAWLVASLSLPRLRRALIAGARCLGRHPLLWQLPAALGAAHVAFACLGEALLHARMHEAFPVLTLAPLPSMAGLASWTWLTGLESTAAVFSVFVGTFPISAWFAFRFLVNGHGLLRELARAVRRRLGALAYLFVPLLVLSALAALVKPLAYLAMPEAADRVPWLAVLGLHLLATPFELLLGIHLLTFLMLLAYGWLRGLHFDRARLRLFAMRRTGYVLKWSLVLLAAAGLLVIGPHAAMSLVEPTDGLAAAVEWFVAHVGRPAFTVLVLACLPVQTILVFHNESLRAALRDGRTFLARNANVVAAFLVASFILFFALDLASIALRTRVGFDTLAGFGIGFVEALGEGAAAGWLIASWVSLYKQSSATAQPT